MYTHALNNPMAKFKRPHMNKTTYMFDEHGILTNAGEDGEYSTSVVSPMLNEEWELIREYIPWQEALQAWIDGKEVVRELSPTSCIFSKNNSFAVSRHELIEGKWYIK
jgi:hypothetical protein